MKLSAYTIVRISALAVGFLPVAFFLLFLIGEGISELFDGKMGVIPILIMMFYAVSGYILAWKRPRMGGIIMLTGGMMMGLYLFITGGFIEYMPAMAYSVPFIVPGVLFMVLKHLNK